MNVEVSFATKYADPVRPGVAMIGAVDPAGRLWECLEEDAIGRIRHGVRHWVWIGDVRIEIVVIPGTALWDEHLGTAGDGSSRRILTALPPVPPRTLH
jgi:hypothetical protein